MPCGLSRATEAASRDPHSSALGWAALKGREARFEPGAAFATLQMHGMHMTKRNKNSTSKRGPKGRFLPGNREGLGRPKGSRNKTTLLIEALL
jgi:hypothetical protein